MKAQIFMTFTTLFIVFTLILYINWFNEIYIPEKSLNKFYIENFKTEIYNLVETSILNSKVEENVNKFLIFILNDIQRNKIKINAVYCFVNETDITVGNFLEKSENFSIKIYDNFGERIHDFGYIENFSSKSKSITPNGNYIINVLYNNESFNFSGSENEIVFSIKIYESSMYEQGSLILNVKRYKK
ncbi:MAG: hypothetical protein QXX01_01890 [Candidatus Aenigmatarchaeota archaeon]|nr:hypothetical protein [Candidatus Aenigmarchaeota archaeon]